MRTKLTLIPLLLSSLLLSSCLSALLMGSLAIEAATRVAADKMSIGVDKAALWIGNQVNGPQEEAKTSQNKNHSS